MAVKDGVEAEPVAVCTVNLPDIAMSENEVAIKTWYENIGMLGWLMDHGIVSAPQRYDCFANVFIPVCVLLIRDDRESYASGQPMPPRQLERESFGRALRGG